MQKTKLFFRFFSVSLILSLATLAIVWRELGAAALFTAFLLVCIEMTFSFDNAIVNAKILGHMSRFWQTMFTTVGILIAVFGMRIVFPILLVMIMANIGAGEALDLALNNPEQYSHVLHDAHPLVFGFGGMFLMMLGLTFFFDKKRSVYWVPSVEKFLQKFSYWWMPAVTSVAILLVVTQLADSAHRYEALGAGFIGIIVFFVMHSLVGLLEARQQKDTSTQVVRTGMAGFVSFLYLEILDGSFSFDGVLGALAITQNIILIAAGLGIGALWIRSLTLFMVRRGTLHSYPYLDHGAHYTLVMLASVMLCGLFFEMPEVITGLSGIMIITASIISSVRLKRRGESPSHATSS